MDAHTSTRHVAADRSTLQRVAMAVGAVFLLVGIAGFIPGITSSYGELTLAGNHSGAKLLGVFEVSVLHNVVHLVFGVAGIAAARRRNASRGYLLGGGAIYLVLWLYGLVVDKESAANFVPVNSADDWLHFVLGAGMIVLGALLGRRREEAVVGHDATVARSGRGTGTDTR